MSEIALQSASRTIFEKILEMFSGPFFATSLTALSNEPPDERNTDIMPMTEGASFIMVSGEQSNALSLNWKNTQTGRRKITGRRYTDLPIPAARVSAANAAAAPDADTSASTYFFAIIGWPP